MIQNVFSSIYFTLLIASSMVPLIYWIKHPELTYTDLVITFWWCYLIILTSFFFYKFSGIDEKKT